MAASEHDVYDIGIGKADITGPCAGLEQRVFARAFIVRQRERAVVFVNCDLGMISELVRFRVLAIKIFGPRLDKPWIDTTPGLTWYGDVVEDGKPQYQPGETATVTFWSAHPSHSQHGASYFDVES